MQTHTMGKIIHDTAVGLNYYLLGYHMAEDSVAYPGIFGSPEGKQLSFTPWKLFKIFRLLHFQSCLIPHQETALDWRETRPTET